MANTPFRDGTPFRRSADLLKRYRPLMPAVSPLPTSETLSRRASIAKLATSVRNEAAGPSRVDARTRHLPRLPLPDRDHQPCCKALSGLQSEPARRRANPGQTRDHGHPQKHSAIGPEIQGRLRPKAVPAPAEASRSQPKPAEASRSQATPDTSRRSSCRSTVCCITSGVR